MQIGVDGGCWSNIRGYGRYARELVGELVALLTEQGRGTVRLYVDRPTAESAVLPRGAEIVIAETREAAARAARDGGRRRLGDLWAYRSAAARDALDVFLFPSVYSYFPLRRGVPAVVGVQDAIPESFPELVFPHLRERALWALKMRAALRRARRVITLSEFSRREVVRHHRVNPSVVDIVPAAPSPIFRPPAGGPDPAVLARYGLAGDRPYFLYVGGLAPHKNLASALEAIAALAEEPGAGGVSLVLAGDHGRDVFLTNAGELQERIARLPAGRVHLVGYVSDEDLVHLYAAARATILPSFSEGFGLPVFEAAACGGATIATRASAAPELLGDATLIVDPHRPAELRDAMRRLLAEEGLGQRLGERGRQRAAGLSWRRSARKLIDVLEEAASVTPALAGAR